MTAVRVVPIIPARELITEAIPGRQIENSGCSVRGQGGNNSNINKTKSPKNHNYIWTWSSQQVSQYACTASCRVKGHNQPFLLGCLPFSLTQSPCATNAGQHSPHLGSFTQGSSSCLSAPLWRSQALWHRLCQLCTALKCDCPSARHGIGLLDGGYDFFQKQGATLAQIFNFP